MRTYTHIIDTKAIKITLSSIPDHWVVRELTERDYGIDLMIEIFRESDLLDNNKRAVYEATGHVCYLQIKGTNEVIKINRDDTVSYQVDKDFLLNAEKYSTPMLLVFVSTIDPVNNQQVYFVWVQRYIIDVLEAEVPDWRSKQGSYSFKIPIKNSLPDNAGKIEHRIAPRIKYLEEHSEFYEKFTLFKEAFPAMVTGSLDEENAEKLILNLRRFRNLSTLLQVNNQQLDGKDLLELIDYIIEYKNGSVRPNRLKDIPAFERLELLESDNFMRMVGENFNAENEGDTVY